MLRRWLRLLSALTTSFVIPIDGDLGPLAQAIVLAVGPGDVVFLSGTIGAGKTTLVQRCARILGITDPVTSPTFALAHAYDGPRPIAHLDLYRLADSPERDHHELLAYLTETVIGFVEWSELGELWLPPAAVTVAIDVTVDGTRQVRLHSAAGARAD